MKILHITYFSEGGGAISIKRLNESLIEKKINSQIFFYDKYLEQKKISLNFLFHKFYLKIKVLIKKVLLKFFIYRPNKETVSFNLFNNLDINQILKEKKIDIVHLHWIGGEMVSLKQIANIEIPIVWTLHDMWPFCGTEHFSYNNRHLKNYSKKSRNENELGIDFNRIVWMKKKKYFSKKKFYLVAPSKWMLKNVIKSQIFKNSKIDTLPSILSLKKWKIDNTKNANIKKREKKVLLFSGTSSVNFRKGFKFLVEAINNYLSEKNYSLIVIGDKPKNFEDIKIEKKYLGMIKSEKELIKIYKKSDIFVLPSLAESFGQVFIEAGSMGLPCVAFKNTGASEIILHKKNGYLANYKSAKDFAEGIVWSKKIIENKNNRKNIRQLVLKKFSSKNRINDYIKLYKKAYKSFYTKKLD